eukprot:Colp12_sorted_trinity150504_noHs@23322
MDTIEETEQLKKSNSNMSLGRRNGSQERLYDLDMVTITQAGSKGGLIFKHIDYFVTSKTTGVTVTRRYSDFDAFNAMLAMRYPFRIIPNLPPKKIGNLDEAFLEDRRQGLERYLMFILRHPVLRDEPMTIFFVGAPTTDFLTEFRAKFKDLREEYQTHPMAGSFKETLPDNVQTQIASIAEKITLMHGVFKGLVETSHHISQRSSGLAGDIQAFSTHVGALSGETNMRAKCWRTDCAPCRQLHGLCTKFAEGLSGVSTGISAKVVQEHEALAHRIRHYSELLGAFKDLFDRQEKNLFKEHQAAYKKSQEMKDKLGRTLSNRNTSTKEIEKLQASIAQKEAEVNQMERRAYFAFYCLQEEARLLHATFAQISHIIRELVVAQLKGLETMTSSWQSLQPLAHEFPITGFTYSGDSF